MNPLNKYSSEEVPPPTHNSFEQGGQQPPFSQVDASTSVQTLEFYWCLFNDPRLSPPGLNVGHMLIPIDAFLDLNHQIYTLIGIMQAIARLLSQLAQQVALMLQPAVQPSFTLAHLGVSLASPLLTPLQCPQQTKATPEAPMSPIMEFRILSLELETQSVDSTKNTLKAQLRIMNQHLDEMQ